MTIVNLKVNTCHSKFCKSKIILEFFLYVNQLKASADIEDWDSLTHITLISEVEDAFAMKFSMKEVLGMQNVGEMAGIIQKNT